MAEVFARLLAKSTKDPAHPRGPETLPGHTAFVLAAADELLAACGNECLRALGFSESELPRLSAIVQLSCVMHDLGKSSDHFQGIVRGTRHAPQLVRHEALSLWLCWPGRLLAEWLQGSGLSALDYRIAVLAAAGHHRKFWKHAMPADGAGPGTTMRLHLDHEDFAATLRIAAAQFGLDRPPAMDAVVIETTRQWSPADDFHAWEQDWLSQIQEDPRRGRCGVGTADANLLALAKAMVIAADVAGSALPRGSERPSWIAEQFRSRPTAESLGRIVCDRLRGAQLRPFQQQLATSSAPVTLVVAGCGTGKTAAAYAWAANRHPGRQIWFAYPTTGTATEGYRGYLQTADLPVLLEHSRAEVDLEILALGEDGGEVRTRDPLDAIESWGMHAVACTVDTVLGLLQNHRKGLYALPALAGAALVFDEIHAYDDRLFANLLRFVSTCRGIPLLLMTASLPSHRAQALREIVRQTHAVSLSEVRGPAEIEELPRYRRLHTDTPWSMVEECLRAHGKVLWVSNTVDLCLQRADAGEARALQPKVYHSRFRYRDRLHRHREVLAAFEEPGPALAITTQVAEMSLDLSADLLLTDLAPVPAMIQRLGRLNRRATPEAPRAPCPFIVIGFDGLPYQTSDLANASAWLDQLGTEAVSQADLVRMWQHDSGPMPKAARSAWLDDGFTTGIDDVRDSTPGLTILLPTDAAEVVAGRLRATEVALPMNPPPSSAGWQSWPVVQHLRVPPAERVHYQPMRGGQWLGR